MLCLNLCRHTNLIVQNLYILPEESLRPHLSLCSICQWQFFSLVYICGLESPQQTCIIHFWVACDLKKIREKIITLVCLISAIFSIFPPPKCMSDDLLIVSTGNGPVNIINTKCKVWKVVKPLGLFCALKIHLKRTGAETGSNLCSDDSDIMN